MDWLAFTLGLKPCIRLRLRPEQAAARAAEAQRQGYVTAELADGDQRLLYIARSREEAEALRGAEAPLVGRSAPAPEQRAAHLELGRRLGYPRCCVEAYADRLVAGALGEGHEDYAFGAAALQASKALHARLNTFQRREHRYLIPYYPCRFDCSWSLRYASGVLEAIERGGRPGEAQRIADALRERIVLTPDGATRPDEGEALPEGGIRLWFDVL